MTDVGRAGVEIVGDVRDFARQTEKDLNAALKKVKPDPVEVPVDTEAMGKAGEKGGEQLAEGVKRGADGRLRNARGHFVSEGEKIGESLGEGVRRGTDGRLRDSRGHFVSEGEKVGRALGDGVNRGFGRDTFRKIRDTLSDGLSKLPGMAGSALASAGSAIGSVLASTIGIALVALAGTVIIPTLAAAVVSGLGIVVGAGLIGLAAVALKDIKPLQNAFKDFTKTLKEVGQQAAKPLLKPFIAGLKGLTELARELKGDFKGIFKDLAPSIKPLIDALGLFLGEVVRGLADAMPGITAAFDAFSKVLPTVGRWLGDFFRTIFENKDIIDNTTTAIMKLIFGPLKLLGPMLSGLNVIFGFLNNALILNTERFGGFLDSLMAFVDGGTGAIERIKAAWGPLGDAIQVVWDKLKAFAGEDDTKLLEQKFDELVQAIKDAWGPLKDFLQVVWDEAVAAIKRIWEENFIPWWNETAKPWLEEAFREAFRMAWEAAKQVTSDALNDIRENVELGANMIVVRLRQVLSQLPTIIINAMISAPGIIATIMGRAAAAAHNGALRVAAGIVNVLITLPSRIHSIISGIQNTIISVFAGAGGWLVNAGVQIMNGLAQGIYRGVERVRGILNEVTDMLPFWKGPPEVDKKILYKSGQLTMQGYEAGLHSEFKSIERTLGALTSGIGGGSAFGVRPAATAGTSSTLTIMPGAIVINGAGSSAGQTAEAVLERLAQTALVRRR
jgi:hypothetical protein